MIILLDYTNMTARVAAITASGAVWHSAPAGRSAATSLATVRRRKAFAGRPECVVVAQGATGTVRDASWSAIRSAVATANAFAFSLGVPVVELALAGGESDEHIATLAREAAKRARHGDWASAAYDGEPNITMPKK